MLQELLSFLIWFLIFYLIFSFIFTPGGIGVFASLVLFLLIFLPVAFGTLVIISILVALLLD